MNLYKVTAGQFCEIWEALEATPDKYEMDDSGSRSTVIFRSTMLGKPVVAVAIYTGQPPRVGQYFATMLACNEAGILPLED
jgi:hypothetical protein